MLKYIIIQAGGKGTRLGYLTENKPKALTSVDNLPMIFHLFRKWPDVSFVIIADYKKDVLRRYLSAFADVKYQVVEASGGGTCGGVRQSLDLIPSAVPFLLIWSDLILPSDFELPEEYQCFSASDAGWSEASQRQSSMARGGYDHTPVCIPSHDFVGISQTFPCRWKYENGVFEENRSTEHGVAGFFLFHDKSVLSDVPESGELVRWMQQEKLAFEELSLAGTREFGLLEEYEKLEKVKTRPFNRIIKEGDCLIKEPVDAQGEELAKREAAWYQVAKNKGIKGIPQIYNLSPLRMEYIDGQNIYEADMSYEQKKDVLAKLVDTLKSVHRIETVPADSFSMKEAYYNKTMNRLSKVEDLVPFAREKYIRVNGRNCRNVFFYRDRLEKALERLTCDHFSFIHGDCTFSNMMLREDGSPVLIDPRGYFGFTELYGDERYDWAKLYYSIVGNYDRFNLKDFRLNILDDEVKLSIESNQWEDMEKDFFDLTETDPYEIKLLHAVIWLSLTTYAWQDYDSVCGAFYNGLYYLEEVL